MQGDLSVQSPQSEALVSTIPLVLTKYLSSQHYHVLYLKISKLTKIIYLTFKQC